MKTIGSDLVLKEGQKFGRLTYIGESREAVYGNYHRYRVVKCRCECGEEFEIIAASLFKDTKYPHECPKCQVKRSSLPAESLPVVFPRIYSIWKGMIWRCHKVSKVNCNSYRRYRGRGITVCDEWRNDFRKFLDWSLENGYASDLSIDRIDNNGGYSPQNCRWATSRQQSDNKTVGHRWMYVEIDGERYTYAEAADKFKIPIGRLRMRFAYGYRGKDLLK